MQKAFITIAVTLASFCATLILLYALVPQQRDEPQPAMRSAPLAAKAVAQTVATIPEPVQLEIQSIDVAATINPVGLTQQGDMDIDDNGQQLAWYKLGPKPGEEGSAVIAGHYGWKDGVASIFNDLHTLKKGDTIVTRGQDGQLKTFVVTRSETYSPNQDATSVFKSDDGKAHLNLITCQGSWNNSAQTYSERLVVFTTLVE